MTKGSLTIILALFFIQNATAMFFNFGSFLKPILEPKGQVFGQAQFHNSGLSNSKVNYFGFKNLPSDKNPLNLLKNLGNLKRNNNPIEETNTDGNDLYEAIGIPQDIIYSKILPVNTDAVNKLNAYFVKRSCTKQDLYTSIKKLKEITEWISSTYLKDVNSLIIGNDNYVQGERVYISGSNQTVLASDVFVLTDDYPKQALTGSNIVRIGDYDIYLDLISYIPIDPTKSIKVLK